MKKVISATALFACIATTAVANDFVEAVSGGTVSGDVVLYGEYIDATESINGVSRSPEAGFANASIGLGYETAQWNGLKAAVGFRANGDFYEKNNGDWDNQAPKAILHTANISYANEYFGVTAGRQEIDLEWMGDFHEAIVAAATPIEGLTITAGYTQAIAIANYDEPLQDFTKFSEYLGLEGIAEVDYAGVVDVKYAPVEGLEINPYFYTLDNVSDWYGAKVNYDMEYFGATAQYAASSEDILLEDGAIWQLEVRGEIADFSAFLGYIGTDKDGGVGSMAALGDNINPLEDGDYVYWPDAETFYVGLGYAIGDFEFGAMYGITEGTIEGIDGEAQEFDFMVDYAVTEQISLGAIYVHSNAELKEGRDKADLDYDKITFTAAYAF